MSPLDVDWKTIAAIGAVVVGTSAFLPYLWEIFKGKTEPHMFTWLIWCITQGTATAGILYGGGGLIGKGLILSTVLVFMVFLLSFKYGTKNITRNDVIILALALLAIVVWWQLNNPVLAILMVTGIDALGYVPTYRKLMVEPWSESLVSWTAFSTAYVLSILSLVEYNLLTVPYLGICLLANLTLIAISLVRRRSISRP
jgi:hypothetical protein